jgi:Ser/Thr protein kinase RdoA (MazF antagonist)
MKPDFTKIANHFRFDGQFAGVSSYGDGHINDTYAARFRNPGGSLHRYLLQRINTNVFKNPIELMQNIERVTEHLQRKIVAAGGDPTRETLTLIPTTEGGFLYQTVEGDYWRAFLFIEDARTFNNPVNSKHIYSAARTLGIFQKNLADFPAEALHETVPNFHHTQKRFETFIKAVELDSHNRASQVKDEIHFVQSRSDETSILTDLLARGELPLRITHNDTKLNNVLIDDKSGEGICLIDLDTVMPGLSLYDFGEAVRAGAALAAEDETELSKAGFSLEIFEQLARGYLEAAQDFLTPAEIEYLPFAAQLMTFEDGMRFLTDYLSGDVYFKIQREHHNLDRCRTQFRMVLALETRYDEMKTIIRKYSHGT